MIMRILSSSNYSLWIIVVAVAVVAAVAADQQLRVADDVFSRKLQQQAGQPPSGSYFQILEFTDSSCTTLTYGQINVINSCVVVTSTISGIYSYSGSTLTVNYYGGLNCVGTVSSTKSFSNLGFGACQQSG